MCRPAARGWFVPLLTLTAIVGLADAALEAIEAGELAKLSHLVTAAGLAGEPLACWPERPCRRGRLDGRKLSS